MKIAVTGALGQLGKELTYIAEAYPEWTFLFTDLDECDITSETSVKGLMTSFDPDYLVNCAAYTAVDRAEEDIEKAYLINEKASHILAQQCAANETILIGISTDYVYDSISGAPMHESAPTTPRSVYGQSKLAGDQAIMKADGLWLIIRVSWLYSSYQHNFVKTMLRLGRERDTLTIVSDQIGTPTYARDLAADLLYIIEQIEEQEIGLNEVYHYSNDGQTTWADFAKAIFDLAHIDCAVEPTTTAAYGAKAPRPMWSVLSKQKITSLFDLDIPHWKDSLRDCLIALEEIEEEPAVGV